MTPSASLLLLLLLGLSQALPLQEEGIEEEEEEEVDEEPVDITTRILTSNNATDEILLEGDLLAPKTRNAMKCWSQSCLWKKGSRGLVTIPFTTSINSPAGRDRRSPRYECLPQKDLPPLRPPSEPAGLRLPRHHPARDQPRSGLPARTDQERPRLIRQDQLAEHQPAECLQLQKARHHNLNTPYDYTSIMHYGKTAFSIQRGKDSITPIPNPNVQIGQRKGMSRWDIVRINKLYRC
ncbi:High choriolytic enzyme 2 [Dissostichus eleginoides]|uniref:Metalloendopeptidase n=1 Tax=Dissostichus eleginoides TaxID=100907 RepID=A0AAD9F3L0_DISEL|nr:High choriolytic enzyme 2 [Dissostichus eleginoides]